MTKGMKKLIENKIMLRFLAVMLVLGGFVFLTLLKHEKGHGIESSLNTLYSEKNKIDRLVFKFSQLERSEAAYCATHNPEFAHQYTVLLSEFRSEAASLNSVLNDVVKLDPQKKQLTDEINFLYKERESWLNTISSGDRSTREYITRFKKHGDKKKNIDSLLHFINSFEDGKAKEMLMSLEENSDNTIRSIVHLLQISFVAMIIFYFTLYKDMKKKKEYGERLQEQIDLFDTAYDQAEMAIFLVHESSGTIRRHNKKALQLFDIKDINEFSGENSVSFIKRLLRDRHPREMVKYLNDERVWASDMVIILNENKKFWGVVAFKQFDYMGVKYDIISVVDITQKKLAEEELEKFSIETQTKNEQLEELNFQLVELNEKLVASENELKEINAQKDKFFSIIAHDLKGPFMGLMGLSDALANDIDSLSKEDVVSFSEMINSASKKLFGLLVNLLDWARIQSGKMEFDPERMYLGEAAREAVAIFEHTAAAKGIRLLNHVDPVTEVVADKNMFQSILRNLIGNALKYTDNGGSVEITNSIEADMVVISVHDNGKGLSEEQIKKIFSFNKSITTQGTKGESGTGLGLALCRELAERNGGELTCHSAPMQGATFSFTLPIAGRW